MIARVTASIVDGLSAYWQSRRLTHRAAAVTGAAEVRPVAFLQAEPACVSPGRRRLIRHLLEVLLLLSSSVFGIATALALATERDPKSPMWWRRGRRSEG